MLISHNITKMQWIYDHDVMHVQLTQRIMFQHLKQFQNHIFPPWHWNDAAQQTCRWTGLSSSRSSREDHAP